MNNSQSFIEHNQLEEFRAQTILMLEMLIDAREHIYMLFEYVPEVVQNNLFFSQTTLIMKLDVIIDACLHLFKVDEEIRHRAAMRRGI